MWNMPRHISYEVYKFEQDPSIFSQVCAQNILMIRIACVVRHLSVKLPLSNTKYKKIMNTCGHKWGNDCSNSGKKIGTS